MPVAFLEEAHGPSSKSKVLASFQRKNHKLQGPDGSKSTYINPDDYLPTQNVIMAGLFRWDARVNKRGRNLCSQQHGLRVDSKTPASPPLKPIQVCGSRLPHPVT